MATPLKNRATLLRISALLSLFTLVAYHLPFFRFVVEHNEGGFNAVMITGGLTVLMLALNFMVYYLLLYLLRFVGRCILALSFVANALTLYFINTYQVLITDKMMGNVFNTQYSEASGFFSWVAVGYLLGLGVVPALYLLLRRLDYGSCKQFFVRTGSALLLSLVVALVNMPNWTWIDRNAPTIGSLLMPWSYTVNSIRYYQAEQRRNQKEILLPEAKITSTSKDLCIVVIGESARRENFSLYGYHKPTNPRLEQAGVTPLLAEASATYTTAGVKAILSHAPSDKLYEILPNYLFRHGVDVRWRTTNWGEPPVHIDHYDKARDLKARYPEADERYDAILLAGLREEILASEADKMVLILHTSTSHGPTYYKKYPAEFERFTPVCTTVEMGQANREELLNAYDNTILYTDHLLGEVIALLREIPTRRSCLLFLSDHGESLGEGNLYMHGVPMMVAPKEQIEIPFLVWTSDEVLSVDASQQVGHYHIFHSVLSFLGIESEVYNLEKDIFR